MGEERIMEAENWSKCGGEGGVYQKSEAGFMLAL